MSGSDFKLRRDVRSENTEIRYEEKRPTWEKTSGLRKRASVFDGNLKHVLRENRVLLENKSTFGHHLTADIRKKKLASHPIFQKIQRNPNPSSLQSMYMKVVTRANFVHAITQDIKLSVHVTSHLTVRVTSQLSNSLFVTSSLCIWDHVRSQLTVHSVYKSTLQLVVRDIMPDVCTWNHVARPPKNAFYIVWHTYAQNIRRKIIWYMQRIFISIMTIVTNSSYVKSCENAPYICCIIWYMHRICNSS